MFVQSANIHREKSCQRLKTPIGNSSSLTKGTMGIYGYSAAMKVACSRLCAFNSLRLQISPVLKSALFCENGGKREALRKPVNFLCSLMTNDVCSEDSSFASMPMVMTRFPGEDNHTAFLLRFKIIDVFVHVRHIRREMEIIA